MSNGSETNSVHPKLALVRKRLRELKLKKRGRNEFSGYSYYELEDFLPQALDLMDQHGLFSKVTFLPSMAYLSITDTETGDVETFESPMSEANLKGMHPVQNLGAVETYLRRYLYITALEIMEPSASDKAPISEDKPKAKSKDAAKTADGKPTYTDEDFDLKLATFLDLILVQKSHTIAQVIKQAQQKYAWPAHLTKRLQEAVEKAKQGE